MFPSPRRSPRVHSEVQEGDKAEHWVSFDLPHVLALPLALPGASMVDASGGCYDCCAKAGGEWKRVWLCQLRSPLSWAAQGKIIFDLNPKNTIHNLVYFPLNVGQWLTLKRGTVQV